MLSTASTSLNNAVMLHAETATSFVSNRAFYDDANFPHGFKRCGDFTNKEAEQLEQYGVAMRELANGRRAPATLDEQHFIDVASGKANAETALEKLWAKYTKLAMGKPFYAVVGSTQMNSRPVAASMDSVEDDVALAEALDEPDDLLD